MHFALEIEIIGKDLGEIDDLLILGAKRLGILLQAGLDTAAHRHRAGNQARI